MLLTYCQRVSKQHAVTCRPGTPVDSFLCHVADMLANMSATRWTDRHMSVVLTLVLTRRHPSLPAKLPHCCRLHHHCRCHCPLPLPSAIAVAVAVNHCRRRLCCVTVSHHHCSCGRPCHWPLPSPSPSAIAVAISISHHHQHCRWPFPRVVALARRELYSTN